MKGITFVCLSFVFCLLTGTTHIYASENPADSINASTAQTVSTTVRGTVTDATGEPIIGAIVKLSGASTGATDTDVSGQFTLSDVKYPSEIEVSYIGFNPVEMRLKRAHRATLW